MIPTYNSPMTRLCKALLSPALVVVISILLVTPALAYYGQQDHPDKEKLFRVLEKRQLRKRDLNLVVKEMRQQGVPYQLTTADEQEIRRLGKYLGKEGLDILVAAIRDSYRPTVNPNSPETVAGEKNAPERALVNEDAKNRREAETKSESSNTDYKVSRLAVGSFTVNGNLDKWGWAGQSTSSFLTIQLQKVAKTISVIDYQLFAPPIRSAEPEYLNGYLNIDHIVSGNLELIDNRNRLNLFVTQVRDKKIKYSEALTTSKNGLEAIIDLQQQATLEVMRALKAGFISENSLERIKLLPTSSLLAYEHYAKAVGLTGQYQKSLSQHDSNSSVELRNRAIKEYEKAIEIDPSFTWPIHNLAVIYSSIFEREKAIQLLRSVLKIDPDFHEARLRMAYLLFEEGIWTKYYDVIDRDEAKGNSLLAEALKEIKLFIAQNADQVDALILEAKLYEVLGQLNKAILILENALIKSPSYSNMRTRLGGLYIEAGRIADAKKQLEKAIELDPNNARAKFMMGELLTKEKNYSEAIKQYEKAAPNGFQEYGIDRSFMVYTLGRAYLDVGELRKAIMSYIQLFTLNPRLSSQAIKDLKEFTKNNPHKLKELDEKTRETLDYIIER